MNDYMFLMHNDVPDGKPQDESDWTAYLTKLRQLGVFQGGSAIGDGICVSKSSAPVAITRHITGYIRVEAESLAAAQELVMGNPGYEAGGTVEIRELPKTS